ncbi:hypothetical protein niasHS_009232 [Heterodera schachtii]|uniref:G-protein coupled receptors family 1 profile domain-containing protein n=1 Tax=Heterodera schachtii TaxID=97005 RepID=A0ABD2J3N7_HETSC
MTNGIISLFCFVGIFLNASLVYVTAKTTKLHTHCPLLLAFHSLTVIPVLVGITFKFLLLLSGVELVPLLRCYHFLLVGLICAGLCTAAQLAIGYDRLLSVWVPTWYKQMNDSKRSLCIMITLCFVRTAYLNANYFFAVSLRPKKLVMCCFDDIAQPEISRRTTKKLVKPLTSIMCITFFCYIQGNLSRIIMPHLNFDLLGIEFYVKFPTNLLFTIAFSSNAPFLYMFSTDHQKAFRSQFKRIFGKMNQSI